MKSLWGQDSLKKERLKAVRLQKLGRAILSMLREHKVTFRDAYIILEIAKGLLERRNSEKRI